MKDKRVENKDLIKAIKAMPCSACLRVGPNDAHHIKTVKSGGHDTQSNLVSLCRLHHQEWHVLGNTRFAEKYAIYKELIVKKGWEFCETRGKWVHNE